MMKRDSRSRTLPTEPPGKRQKLGLTQKRVSANVTDGDRRTGDGFPAEAADWVWEVVFSTFNDLGVLRGRHRRWREVGRKWRSLFDEFYLRNFARTLEFSCPVDEASGFCRVGRLSSIRAKPKRSKTRQLVKGVSLQPLPTMPPLLPLAFRLVELRINEDPRYEVGIPFLKAAQQKSFDLLVVVCPKLAERVRGSLGVSRQLTLDSSIGEFPEFYLSYYSIRPKLGRLHGVFSRLETTVDAARRLLAKFLRDAWATWNFDSAKSLLLTVRGFMFHVGDLWLEATPTTDSAVASPSNALCLLLWVALRIVRASIPVLFRVTPSEWQGQPPLYRLFLDFRKRAFEFFRSTPSAFPDRREELAGLCWCPKEPTTHAQ